MWKSPDTRPLCFETAPETVDFPRAPGSYPQYPTLFADSEVGNSPRGNVDKWKTLQSFDLTKIKSKLRVDNSGDGLWIDLVIHQLSPRFSTDLSTKTGTKTQSVGHLKSVQWVTRREQRKRPIVVSRRNPGPRRQIRELANEQFASDRVGAERSVVEAVLKEVVGHLGSSSRPEFPDRRSPVNQIS